MKYYYGKYWGCDWWPVLVLKNILRPSRLITRWRYGNVWQASFSDSPLHNDGIHIWPGRFAAFADAINKQYTLHNWSLLAFNGYAGEGYLPMTDAIKQIILDPLLLAYLKSYFGFDPHLRELLHHSIAFPSSDMKPTRCMDAAREGFNVGWHYDTPNLLQLVILLNDVTEKDSHMQYAKGEHRRLRVNLCRYDYYYSDEYAQDHFDVVKCVGPKGTAFLFDANAPHRFFMVKDSLRAMVKVGYTPGNAILRLSSFFENLP